ncbi:MAG: inosine/xanthosine triphosphatase [Desulfobacterales bacterium]|nr:inosine/xanthosine triphosphatase [Desulfobacterales bacterium]
MVRVCVGSENPNKQEAVKRAFAGFPKFKGAEYLSYKAASGVSDQPLGYEETLMGADNRAREAFFSGKVTLGVGLESGLVEVPGSTTGHMNLTACSLFDGEHFFRGVGPGFELPEIVCEMVVKGQQELDEAVHRAGLSDNTRIGYAQGIIGVLSGGAVTREDYMVPSVTMALVALCAEVGGVAHA